nr:ATP-binding protein [Anaerolineae bacterium]
MFILTDLHIQIVMAAFAVLIGILALTALLNQPKILTVRLPANLESANTLYNYLLAFCRDLDIEEQCLFHCRLALDEACTNIVQHAYQNQASGTIKVLIRYANPTFTIVLTDYGEPRQLYASDDLAPARSLEEVSPGGLGLFLIHRVMDRVSYRSGTGANRLMMVKHCLPGHAVTPSR